MNKSLNIEAAEALLMNLTRSGSDGLFRPEAVADIQLIDELKALGVPIVESLEGCYRLSVHAKALDSEQIRAGLQRVGLNPVQQINCLKITGSTNTWLLRHEVPQEAYMATTAEFQTHGRGRRGHRWISSYGGHLYLSIAYRSDRIEPAGIVPLNTALAVREALSGLGFNGIGIKWPNDLYHEENKLGGILVEGAIDRIGQKIVIGIGVNIRQDPALDSGVDQAVTSLERISGDESIDRNRVASAIIDAVLGAIESPASGLVLQERWQVWDICRGRAVEIITDSGKLSGVGAGIDKRGAFLLRTPEGVCSFFSGDVSLRLRT